MRTGGFVFFLHGEGGIMYSLPSSTTEMEYRGMKTAGLLKQIHEVNTRAILMYPERHKTQSHTNKLHTFW